MVAIYKCVKPAWSSKTSVYLEKLGCQTSSSKLFETDGINSTGSGISCCACMCLCVCVILI